MLIYKRPTVILALILISAVAGSLGAKSLMSQQQSPASKSPELHGSIRESAASEGKGAARDY